MVVAYGADYSQARPTQAMLNKHGITFVCRYLLDDARNQGKAMKKAEALQLSSWGMAICANFEYATHPNGTEAQGAEDARVALAELQKIGAPRRIVYFSFDYDVQPGDLAGCLRYMNGAAMILGKANVGAYGNYRLIQFLGQQGFKWLWQTYAWSGGKWSAYATVRQIHNGAFPGEFDGDLNTAMVADYGQWILGDNIMQVDPITWDHDISLLTDGYAKEGKEEGFDRAVQLIFWKAFSAARDSYSAKQAVGQMDNKIANLTQQSATNGSAISALHQKVDNLRMQLTLEDRQAIIDGLAAVLNQQQNQVVELTGTVKPAAQA